MMSKNEKRAEQLSLQVMDELGIDPEEFGAVLYSATTRRMAWDPQVLKTESWIARRRICAATGGRELIELERKIEREMRECCHK